MILYQQMCPGPPIYRWTLVMMPIGTWQILFFDCRWSYLPVLHRLTFVNEHLNPFLSKSVTSPISSFLVNMVCAIATTEKSSFQEDSRVHRFFFNRAVQDLHAVLGIDDLECVQCLLLLCMYGHNEPQSVNMWYTTGLALQLAIGIDYTARRAFLVIVCSIQKYSNASSGVPM